MIDHYFADLRLVAQPFFAAADRLADVIADFFDVPLDFLDELLVDFLAEPVFFLAAPPVFLLTVAQPMRSAVFSLPPRSLTLSSMCAAILFCLLE